MANIAARAANGGEPVRTGLSVEALKRDFTDNLSYIHARFRQSGAITTITRRSPIPCATGFSIWGFAADLKGGLVPMLMNRLIGYLRSRGTGEIVGEALNNRRLIALVMRPGFEVSAMPGTGTVALRFAAPGSRRPEY
jgi:hypothetical protein